MKTTVRIVMTSTAITLLLGVPLTTSAHLAPNTATTAPQQTAEEVTYDAPVEGTITNEAFEQRWTFNAATADRINIRVERTDGNLIPDVSLLDNNNQAVTGSYGADRTRAVAEIENTTLNFAGALTILVTREQGTSGVTTGGYRLTVTPLGVAQDHPNNATVIGPIEYDSPVTGEITATHWMHRFALQGEAGDWIQMTAKRANGTLYPLVDLLDSNGQVLTTGYTEYTGVLAQQQSYGLPYTGEYQVVAYRDSGINGDTQGGFELTVTLLGSGEESQRLISQTPQVIDQYNTALQGEITNTLWYQDWQFRTEAGDTVTISAWRSPDYLADTPNALQPHVVLLDSTGSELQRAYVEYTGERATIDHYTFGGAGTYTVRVMREGEKDGPTTGTYQLMVTLDGAGEGSPLLEGTPGEVAVGAPVQGALDNAHWRQTWTFSGNEGDQVTLVATRTDGTLVPRLEIFDNNGVSQYSAYYDNTEDTVRIEGFRLPYTGDYQITVFREGAQNGYTSGGYTLEITLAAQ